jgi:nifR3 family TIM-barrel protein
MAGITDPPFRRAVQRFGVSAVWTEMVSSDAVLRNRGVETFDIQGHHVPTVFQLYGRDPHSMAEAAGRVQDRGASAVDINMGCPVRRVVAKGGGAALMKDPLLAARIVAAVRKAVDVAVTVKIRSGWDETSRNASTVARLVEQEGADCVIIHSRSRSKGHSGPVSLDVVRELKELMTIPVIGNGGLFTVHDAEHMLSETECDGLMIARGALGRPWFPAVLLHRLSSAREAPAGETKVGSVIRDHYREQLARLDPLTAVRRMRKHLVWYSRGHPNATQFRIQVMRMEDPSEVLDVVNDFFGQATIQ